MDKQKSQDSTLNDKHVQFRSKAVVMVSTVKTPNFIRHKLNTDLKLKPRNFLSNEAESLGVRYTAGDSRGFSSFQMANMFLECIGKEDIVSNAENIKKLCKIPYNKKSVSIMVHRIDKTLLLDEFDVEEHLTQDTSEKWTWLKKFFYKNIVQSSNNKVERISFKKNSSRKIEHKNLVSKFLHHSIGGLDSHIGQIKNVCNDTASLASPLLKQLMPKEVFPERPQINQLFNRNVLWDFNDLKMFIGTDLPIFRNDNNSSLSTRLRNMSKPLSVLTAIDYWLENLMNDIPVTEFCYHINGIVQKYEQVKTENIPCLNGSNFSPSLIYDYMQYMISFLKENTLIIGHTYWLFKGKNEDNVNIYDLTTLCSESLIDSPNPFTIPVAMLLYRVAHKLLKHNLESGKPFNLVNIILLLNNTLKLLDKTKYPEIVIFVNYMLLDIYNKMYIDSLRTNDLNYCDDYSDTCHVVNVIPSCYYKNYEIVSHEKNSISQISEYLISKYNLKPVDKCLYKALYYIGSILCCLQHLKNDKDIMVKLEERLSSDTRHITNFISEIIASNKKNYKGMKKKNQYQDFKNLEDIESYIITELISMSWINSPNVQNSDLDNFDLSQLLYENAFKIYFILGEKCCASKNFGTSVNYVRRSLECKLRVSNNKVFDSFEDILKHFGDCFSSIVISWGKIEQYITEIESVEMFDFELRKMLLHNSSEYCTNKDLNLIPTKILKSKKSILSLAEHCYSRALLLTSDIDKKNILNRRMGFVYNEYTTFYMNEIIMAIQTNTPLTPIKLKWLIKRSKHYFTLGSDMFKDQGDLTNFTRIGIHFANLNVIIYAHNKCSKYQISVNEFMKDDNLLFKAIKIYEKVLSEFNNDRNYNPSLWDDVNYELFSVLYFLSVQKYSELQPGSTRSQQKCIIDSFNKALSFCDLENDTPYRFEYEYRSAHIHSNLANLFSNRLEEYISNESPEIDSVLLQIESYYNISYETYLKINCTFDCLDVVIKMIKLDMCFIDGTMDTQHAEKNVKSIIKKLKKCDTVFQKFLENKDSMKLSNNLNLEKKKFNFLKILYQNVCNLLKCMIKLGLTKTSKWLSDNVDQLKSIYKELLRNFIGDNNYLQLKIAINQLFSFSDN